MTKRTLLAASIAIAFAGAAAAADTPRAESRPPTPKPDMFFDFDFDFDVPTLLADAGDAQRHADAMREWADAFTADMQGSMAFMFSDRVGRGKLVKGAPYSAEIVTERNQSLADGNAITHESRSRVYRDAEGRTRQETMRGDKPRSVYISDPVAGMSYTLLPGAKIAFASPRHEHTPHAPRAPRVERDKMSGDTTIVSGEKRIVVKRSEGDDGMPGAEEVRVQVYRLSDEGREAAAGAHTPPAVAPPPPIPPLPPADLLPPIPPLPPMPGVHTMRFESTAGLGKGATANLGTKSFDGVSAEGKSTTWTIPAGKIGNKKPIQIVSESWYSPELQVTMYSRYSDPRTGESIYRLAGVKRAEPAADLFKVPDDYKTRKRGDMHTPPPAPPTPPAPPAPESRR
jgi:hypothetical protein